jgi:Raf kinase inhibitor-like YbhB/YbcL family protein
MLRPPHLRSARVRRTLTSYFLTGSLLLAACSSKDGTSNAASAGAGGIVTAGASAAGAGASVGGGSAGLASAGTIGSMAGATGGGTTVGGSSAAGGSQGGASTGGNGTSGSLGGSVTAGSGMGGSGTGGATSAPFALTSTVFKEGDQIPIKYKCAQVNPKGQNVSPPLSWGPGPAGTKSYALVLMHLPSPEHWVIWDIPASVTSLPEDIEHQAQPMTPAGSKQSRANLDGFMGSGYLGPCPQTPNSVQSYRFTLYAVAVDTLPGLSDTSSPTAAASAVVAHLVPGSQSVSLTGTQIQTP